MNKEINPTNNFEGFWWIPNEKKRKCPGKLSISASEIGLELNGSVIDENQITTNKHVSIEIILGELFNGDKITLASCHFKSAQIGKATKVVYNVINVYKNTHFTRLKKIRFKIIKVHFWYLNEWHDNYEIKLKPFVPSSHITAKYKDPKKTTVKINSELTISLIREIIDKSVSFPITKFEIKPEAYFTLKYSKEKSINDIESDIERLQNFLTLCVGEPTHPYKILGMPIKNSKQVTMFGQRFIEIYSKLPTLTKKSIRDNDCLIVFSQIKNKFPNLLKKWWGISEDLDSVLRLYFDVIYYPTLSKEVKFLYATQAIESYHRLKMQIKSQTKTEKKRRVDILNALPKNYKNWLSQRFPREEPILYTRLYAILKKITPIVGQSTQNQKEEFIHKFKDTRNYLTHHDESGKKFILKGNELEWFAMKIQFILLVILLQEMRFNSKKIKNLIQIHIPDTFILKRFF